METSNNIENNERNDSVIKLVFKYLHSDLFPKLNLDVINRISDNKYRIILRKTATLQDRFKEIEKKVNKHLATRTIDEFI